MQNQLTEAARKLSIPDRITLVEEIWDTIAEENQAFELTDAQKRELDRRLESSRANPGQGRTWEEIKAEFMKSIDDALLRIVANPDQYPNVYRSLRRCVVRRFPFAIFYEVASDEVEVIAVFHSRRDPERWNSRR